VIAPRTAPSTCCRICRLATKRTTINELKKTREYSEWFSLQTHTTTRVAKRTNRNMHAMNTLVQLLTLYTNPESHNAQRHRQTDGQTDGRRDDKVINDYANSRSYCVAVRSAKSVDKVVMYSVFLNDGRLFIFHRIMKSIEWRTCSYVYKCNRLIQLAVTRFAFAGWANNDAMFRCWRCGDEYLCC